MGVQELLLDYVRQLPPPVKRILVETIVAEQALLDLDRPKGIKETIKDIIDREARQNEQETR